MILMKMKDVKDLGLRTRWSDNDDMKIVNDMKDLSLKVFWSEILICLKRLRMPRAKKLIIESRSDKKEIWSDSKFKTILLSYCALNSAFNNIIMITLNNRMLNDPKFDDAVATWWFAIINLANVVIMMMLLCYNCISSHIFYHS